MVAFWCIHGITLRILACFTVLLYLQEFGIIQPLGALAGNVLSVSSVQKCFTSDQQSSAESEFNGACSDKIVISYSVESATTTGTDFMEISSAVDNSTGTTAQIAPWRFWITKTKSYLRYPLKYIQNVNVQPYENSVGVPWIVAGSTPCCSDAKTFGASKVTCGLVKPVQYQKDEDLCDGYVCASGGFCCGCAGMNGQLVQSGQGRGACTKLGFDALTSKAYCLRFGDEWARVYQVGVASMWYDIVVTVQYKDNTTTTAGDWKFKNITLSHENIAAYDSDVGLLVKLIQDGATASAWPVWQDYFVMWSADAADQAAASSSGSSNSMAGAMLFPGTMVNLEGNECNKIGVSYTAYNAQSCNAAVGDCIQSQIADFRKSDAALMADGKPAKYTITDSFQGWTMLYAKDYAGQLNFQIEWQGRQTTQLSLEMNGGSVKWIVQLATARIVKMTLSNFEAQTETGTLTAAIQNTGTVSAEYYVSVTDCCRQVNTGTTSTSNDGLGNSTVADTNCYTYGDIALIPAQTISLTANQTLEVDFTVDAAQETGYSYSCTVSVMDANGGVCDSKSLAFGTSSRQENYGAQGKGTTGGTDNSYSTINYGSGGSSCFDSEGCTYVSINCLVSSACSFTDKVKIFFASVAAAAGIAAAMAALLFAFKTGCIQSICSGACSCLRCCFKGSGSHQSRSNRHKKKISHDHSGKSKRTKQRPRHEQDSDDEEVDQVKDHKGSISSSKDWPLDSDDDNENDNQQDEDEMTTATSPRKAGKESSERRLKKSRKRAATEGKKIRSHSRQSTRTPVDYEPESEFDDHDSTVDKHSSRRSSHRSAREGGSTTSSFMSASRSSSTVSGSKSTLGRSSVRNSTMSRSSHADLDLVPKRQSSSRHSTRSNMSQ